MNVVEAGEQRIHAFPPRVEPLARKYSRDPLGEGPRLRTRIDRRGAQIGLETRSLARRALAGQLAEVTLFQDLIEFSVGDRARAETRSEQSNLLIEWRSRPKIVSLQMATE